MTSRSSCRAASWFGQLSNQSSSTFGMASATLRETWPCVTALRHMEQPLEERPSGVEFQDPGDYTPRCRVFWTPDGLRGVPPRAWIEDALRRSLAAR